jgi:hypothetical protein
MPCTELRIGASEAGLLELRHRGIPDPETWTFAPYTVTRIAGTGQIKSYGYPTASWSWAILDQFALGKLLAFFSASADASVQVYISTYTDTGWSREAGDYTAYMQRPIDGDGKAMVEGSQGNVFENVTVQFTHLEAA